MRSTWVVTEWFVPAEARIPAPAFWASAADYGPPTLEPAAVNNLTGKCSWPSAESQCCAPSETWGFGSCRAG